VVFTLAGGGFGAGIGGLVGSRLPNPIPVHSGEYAAARATDKTEVETGKTTTYTIGVGRPDDASSGASRGAALGAACGLILGLILGIPIALMDGFVAQIVEWVAKRKGATD
jgi:hypothetical protein